MRPVHFAAARRTPIGKLRGSLSSVRPDDLAALVIRGLVADLPALDPARIDDVYWGAANQAPRRVEVTDAPALGPSVKVQERELRAARTAR